jgi:hypothetical protein
VRETISLSPWKGKRLISNGLAVSMPSRPIFFRTEQEVGPCSDSAATRSDMSATVTSSKPKALIRSQAMQGLPQVSMNLSCSSRKIVPSSTMRPSSVHQTT